MAPHLRSWRVLDYRFIGAQLMRLQSCEMVGTEFSLRLLRPKNLIGIRRSFHCILEIGRRRWRPWVFHKRLLLLVFAHIHLWVYVLRVSWDQLPLGAFLIPVSSVNLNSHFILILLFILILALLILISTFGQLKAFRCIDLSVIQILILIEVDWRLRLFR